MIAFAIYAFSLHTGDNFNQDNYNVIKTNPSCKTTPLHSFTNMIENNVILFFKSLAPHPGEEIIICNTSTYLGYLLTKTKA